MLVILMIIIMIIIAIIVTIYCTSTMSRQNVEEKYEMENLRKRIDELDDDDDFGTTGTGKTIKIMVPDNVDIKDPTKKSTQKEDCKEYTVRTDAKIEKTVISGDNKKTESFVNDEISTANDEDDDNPIKENKKIFF